MRSRHLHLWNDVDSEPEHNRLRRSPVFGVWTFDVLAFLEVRLQVHGEQWGAGGVVGAADRPVVAAGLVLSEQKQTHRSERPKRAVLGSVLRGVLARRQFNGEWAAQRVHLKRSGLSCHVGGRGRSSAPSGGGSSAAVFAVDKKLPDLLSDGDVVHHDGELGGIHRALICEVGGRQEVGMNQITTPSGKSTPVETHLKSRRSVCRRCAAETNGNVQTPDRAATIAGRSKAN